MNITKCKDLLSAVSSISIMLDYPPIHYGKDNVVWQNPGYDKIDGLRAILIYKQHRDMYDATLFLSLPNSVEYDDIKCRIVDVFSIFDIPVFFNGEGYHILETDVDFEYEITYYHHKSEKCNTPKAPSEPVIHDYQREIVQKLRKGSKKGTALLAYRLKVDYIFPESENTALSLVRVLGIEKNVDSVVFTCADHSGEMTFSVSKISVVHTLTQCFVLSIDIAVDDLLRVSVPIISPNKIITKVDCNSDNITVTCFDGSCEIYGLDHMAAISNYGGLIAAKYLLPGMELWH